MGVAKEGLLALKGLRSDLQDLLAEEDYEGYGYARAQYDKVTQDLLGNGAFGDYVLNLAPLHGITDEERDLFMQEVQRAGLDTNWNHPEYPFSYCITVGYRVQQPDDAAIATAFRMYDALLAGRGATSLQYVFFPFPYTGEFTRIAEGDYEKVRSEVSP